MCGADLGVDRVRLDQGGSPPRVRSRRDGREGLPQPLRITSACAEQTQAGLQLPQHRADHLRVCGADHAEPVYTYAPLGSPPRVRSRLVGLALAVGLRGITSACAEQTTVVNNITYNVTDHLRVCGADTEATTLAMMVGGSPPRVRSRQDLRDRRRETLGITSACAEQTPSDRAEPQTPRDHLRVCGADRHFVEIDLIASGSPPRVRSRPSFCGDRSDCLGITSACAEQTLSAHS